MQYKSFFKNKQWLNISLKLLKLKKDILYHIDIYQVPLLFAICLVSQ